MYLKALIQNTPWMKEILPEQRRQILESIYKLWILYLDSWRIRRKFWDRIDNIISQKEEQERRTREMRKREEQLARKFSSHDLLRVLSKHPEITDFFYHLTTEEVDSIDDSIQIWDLIDLIAILLTEWDDRKENYRRWWDIEILKHPFHAEYIPQIFDWSRNEQDNCHDNEYHNSEILDGKKHKFILIELNGRVLGHIKLNWEDTFLSYVDSRDSHWRIRLVKGGIYSISGYSKIVRKRVREQDVNYVKKLYSLKVRFLRFSDIPEVRRKIDEHVWRISQRNKIYF